ncbi:MAG: hypothetical protein AAF798_04555 [Bacteroidota bacterium]
MSLEVPEQTFITPTDLLKRYQRFDPNIWTRWQRAGKVVKLRNGLYLNKNYQIRGDLDRFVIANQMYSPSYISLHSALRYYNLIPEAVFEVTSISTRKTKAFDNNYTLYSFRKLQPSYFFGYKVEPWRGNYYAIAYLEKAILDMMYLDAAFSDSDYLLEMRFNQEVLIEEISWDRMNLYLKLYDSGVVSSRVELLKKVYGL